MESKKIQKINLPYLLAYVLVPALLMVLGFWLAAIFNKGTMAVVMGFGVPVACFLWWVLAGRLIYKHKQKKLVQELEQAGFVRNQTFLGRGCYVVVDVNHGQLALLFFWNPFQTYVLPASRIEKAWVDDGRGGSGFMEGSSRVSFLFQIDGVSIRVNTFTSNKRWRMDSDYILTGISKADLMIEVLESAKSRSK